MLEENLKDSGEIIQNILTQPLSIPGAEKDLSLLEAAESFDPAAPLQSDLRKVLLSLLQFPHPTEMMIRELEILHNELRSS